MAIKKKEDAPAPGSPAWMSTYGDMVTLLLTFFIMLYAMSDTNTEKMKQIAVSMRSYTGSTGVLGGGEALIDNGNLIGSGVLPLPAYDAMFSDQLIGAKDGALQAAMEAQVSEMQDTLEKALSGEGKETSTEDKMTEAILEEALSDEQLKELANLAELAEALGDLGELEADGKTLEELLGEMSIEELVGGQTLEELLGSDILEQLLENAQKDQNGDSGKDTNVGQDVNQGKKDNEGKNDGAKEDKDKGQKGQDGQQDGSQGKDQGQNGESIAKETLEKLLEQLDGGKTLEELIGNLTMDDLEGNKTLEELLGDEALEKALENQALAELVGGLTLDDLVGNKTLEELIGGKTLDDLSGQKLLEELLGGKTVEELVGGMTPQDLLGGMTIEELIGNKTLDELTGNQTLEELLGNKTIDKLTGNKQEAKEIGGQTASEYLGANKLEDLFEGNKTAEEFIGNKTDDDKSGNKDDNDKKGNKTDDDKKGNKTEDDKQGLSISEQYGDQVQVSAGNGYVKITFGDGVLFDTGKAELKSNAKQLLKSLYDALKDFEKDGNEILIEGHTDNVPIHTAKYPNNWYLSSDRALAVLSYYVDMGIKPTSISATGYGEFYPIATNETEEGRAKNRRVEIKIVSKYAE